MRPVNCNLSTFVWQTSMNNWRLYQVVMVFVETILNIFLWIWRQLLITTFSLADFTLVRDLSIAWSCWIEIILTLWPLFSLLKFTLKIFILTLYISVIELMLKKSLGLLDCAVYSKLWHWVPSIKLLGEIWLVV